MFWKIIRNRKMAALRRQLKHERLSEYKIISTVTYTVKWADMKPDYVCVIFKQNGYGQRQADLGGYYYKDIIRTSDWWAKEVTPWLNNISKPKIQARSDNVVKLELVKK